METIAVGAEVVDADGEHLGNVIAAAPDYIVVERGLFFPTDYYIPRTAIAEAVEGRVRLAVTKHNVLDQGWDVQPDAAAHTDTQG